MPTTTAMTARMVMPMGRFMSTPYYGPARTRPPTRTRLKDHMGRPRVHTELLISVPLTQWGDTDLPCQLIGGGKIALALHQRAPNQQHCVVRRHDLFRNPFRNPAVPAWSANEVVASLRPRGAAADVGEHRTPRISKLDGVIATSHVGHM